ncbi:MAG: hypothetical protein GY945_10430, partial [Rhodobacteraceae bacterium]|nr:hypothetical protein [Paracoccaceae bacterium]
LEERRKARAAEKAIEIAFKEFAPRWPTWVHDSEPAARKAWGSLSDEERAQAVARFEDYIAASKVAGRTQTCSLARYLGEKKWEKLEPPEPKADQPIRLKPFGKGWMMHRFQLLDRGRAAWQASGYLRKMIDDGKGELVTDARHRGEFPLVARLDEDAQAGRCAVLRSGTPMPEIEGYHAVEQGSPEWDAWAAWHRDNDYPWINPPEHHKYIWLPSVLPHGDSCAALRASGGATSASAIASDGAMNNRGNLEKEAKPEASAEARQRARAGQAQSGKATNCAPVSENNHE